jgi:hypothetical protein
MKVKVLLTLTPFLFCSLYVTPCVIRWSLQASKSVLTGWLGWCTRRHQASSLLQRWWSHLARSLTCAALTWFTFYLLKWTSSFKMTSENGLWTTVSSSGQEPAYLHPAVNHCLFPPSSTDTWLYLVSSNSSCCFQWNFHHLGSMSQNGSTSCLTNELRYLFRAECL